MLIWGKNPMDLPAFSGRDPIHFMGAVIQPQYFWVIAFLVGIVILLTLFFNKTIIGKAMSACADNPNAASLVGINVKQMILLAFSLSAAIGAVAGIIITPISLMEYDRGTMLAVKAFGAVVLGGLGSPIGALVGGLILGLIEGIIPTFMETSWVPVFEFLLFILILLIRPNAYDECMRTIMIVLRHIWGDFGILQVNPSLNNKHADPWSWSAC